MVGMVAGPLAITRLAIVMAAGELGDILKVDQVITMRVLLWGEAGIGGIIDKGFPSPIDWVEGHFF
jgi:hypothetical protein